MRTIFHDLESLRQDLPEVAEIIERENKDQYPNARFIVAGLVNVAAEGEKDLVAFFDVGTKDMVLWVWVAGDFSDPYIDEYYEIPIAEAVVTYGEVFNNRKLLNED